MILGPKGLLSRGIGTGILLFACCVLFCFVLFFLLCNLVYWHMYRQRLVLSKYPASFPHLIVSDDCWEVVEVDRAVALDVLITGLSS